MSLGRIALVIASLALAFGGMARAQVLVGNAVNEGVSIAYEVHGSGDPLVLIPGFSQSRKVWDEAGFLGAFLDKGRQIILIDPRGHGDSAKPHDPVAYGPEAVARDVISVLDELGIERADLLGYSRGGWIAIAAAVHHPERVRSVVAGGAHPYAEDLGPYRTGVAGGLEDWVEVIESGVGTLPEDQRAMFLANDADALRAAVAANRADVSAALDRSGVPVFLYAGSEDPRAQMARKFAEAHREAEFLELPHMNHFQAFFSAGQVADAADQWLRRLASASAAEQRRSAARPRVPEE